MLWSERDLVPVTGAQADPLVAYSRLDMRTDLKPFDAIWQDVLSIKIKGRSLIGSESGSRKSINSLRHKKNVKRQILYVYEMTLVSHCRVCHCTRLRVTRVSSPFKPFVISMSSNIDLRMNSNFLIRRLSSRWSWLDKLVILAISNSTKLYDCDTSLGNNDSNILESTRPLSFSECNSSKAR
jgi:hypothetical protein